MNSTDRIMKHLLRFRLNRARELLHMCEVYHLGGMPELRDICEAEFWKHVGIIGK